MVIIWTSTLEIEHDAKYPSQYDSTRCSQVTLDNTIQTSYRLLPSIVLRRGSTEHCVRATHVIATRPCPSATDIGHVGGMLTIPPPSCPRPLLGLASSPSDADEGGDMQPREPHRSHLSSLWHLSHATTGTDATIIPTTRCALPLVGQQPAVSRQNESQLSSRLTMSFQTKANSGISDVDKRDPFDAVPLAAMIAGMLR
ncbi:LOW QUALITY PROTEIN: hypothetical protein QBC45DRAFT_462011 [Copromyces sp. CBS 386.78]|nr:LOW QUALITY PROTEIN: hypothetical protein QBC45DRAFT_462011 [Copromyces sp. CBS 386.78]